jgi:AcrR family transcriptional regulator
MLLCAALLLYPILSGLVYHIAALVCTQRRRLVLVSTSTEFWQLPCFLVGVLSGVWPYLPLDTRPRSWYCTTKQLVGFGGFEDMPESVANTEARERVLDAAERLFAKKGYAAVTLRDIAADVGIRHTSLYHHVPGGKEQLFIEVTERHLARHRAGLTQAIAQSRLDIRSQLYAAADWLLSQPPMDLVRMVYSDMPAIETSHANRLSQVAYDSMLSPIEEALVQARARGEIQHQNMGLIAGAVVGMVETMYAVPEYALEQSREAMACEVIDVLLDGLRPR